MTSSHIHENEKMNKTGVRSHIDDSRKTMTGSSDLTEPPPGDSTLLADVRIQYMKEAGSLGNMPTSSMPLFLDKLSERLAFERTGTRLYEALISKYQGNTEQHNYPTLETLEQFYLEELQHFNLMADTIMKLGGDPTLMTPASDIVGLTTSGWIAVMHDPRTTFLQCLQVILEAELIDNAGWERLIVMAQKEGQTALVKDFKKALKEESEHLRQMKHWMTLNEGAQST